MAGYESTSLTAIEGILDGLDEATAEQVYQATLQFAARALAAVAASRADTPAGASFPNEWTVGDDGDLTIDADPAFGGALLLIRHNGNAYLHVNSDGVLQHDDSNGDINLNVQDTLFKFGGTPAQPVNFVCGNSGFSVDIQAGDRFGIYSLSLDQFVFRVDADGSVHIPTGTTIQADL